MGSRKDLLNVARDVSSNDEARQQEVRTSIVTCPLAVLTLQHLVEFEALPSASKASPPSEAAFFGQAFNFAVRKIKSALFGFVSGRKSTGSEEVSASKTHTCWPDTWWGNSSCGCFSWHGFQPGSTRAGVPALNLAFRFSRCSTGMASPG
eukprot:CAMPEP_0197683556 /NCGR_PEP_ID=MMETSP1338-20131121/98149_1 /TAXON_ID=43686 ORGANISM="Pelagodinium beii, Strain RCC1491" /NCGR_SAMPLE_ID=MMETSP1338 /ASSEMBLY_ACC=CAM_ASM_000754 /LENGTH=149 /DNA_ID=CAMNT_0043265163 /DNA_START=442 /DNA_END=892 /DNA_ORIENTATION=-